VAYMGHVWISDRGQRHHGIVAISNQLICYVFGALMITAIPSTHASGNSLDLFHSLSSWIKDRGQRRLNETTTTSNRLICCFDGALMITAIKAHIRQQIR
jgi:hypothetical protein